jgi:CRP-like cAMP-binding protein
VDPRSPTRNLVIAALPPAERSALLQGARRASLTPGRTVYEQDAPLDAVYFPLAGALSMLTVLEDGDTIEVAIVGRESLLGFPLGLVAEHSPWRCVVQLAGEAVVVDRAVVRAQLAQPGLLGPLITHQAGGLMHLMAQSGACNHFHPIGQRCSRWLLMMHDRAEADTFPVTQQFLAEMIGARRPSISLAVQELRDTGAISYVRGVLTVEDRGLLERAACECYARVRRQADATARMLLEAGAANAG